ncbi:MAG: DNA polymerase III subunit gamma/tau [Pirellulales bacterium]
MAASDQDKPEPALPLTTNASVAQYVVVARRYRPQTFDELIGQEHVARALTGAIAANRVGHAYLFTGARGVGKTSAARILAKALNCIHGPTATPCNRCDICESISAGSDVDVLEIDGASNRGIDEIRQLRQNVSIRPSRARHKIYIIDEVHMLTREAFNALLKTLEEPPEHVKFIFCTTEPTKIPITILSRCQRFDFAGIGQQAIVARLQQIVDAEGTAVEPAALAILARRAAGSMRDSQSLLEQLLAFGGAKITAADVHGMLGTASEARMAALVDHLVAHDPAAAISDLDAALIEGVEVGQLLEQLLGYFRDTLVAAVGCAPETLLHTSPSEHEHLAAAGKQLGLETILAVLQILDHTLSRLRYSTQGRTLAEMALVRIAELENLAALSETIAELRAAGPASGAATGESRAAAPATRTSQSTTHAAAAKKKAEPNDGDPSDESLQPAEREPRVARPLNAESVQDIWRDALANLTDLLSDNAARAERVSLADDDRLVATFRAKYTSCKTFCERDAQRATLENALALVAGQPVQVEFRVVDDEPAVAAPRVVVPHRQQMAAMSEHPLVVRAGELFGAQLVRVDRPENE